MAKKSGSDKNFISVWHWLLLFLLFAIPCVGLGIFIALAFVGENESRKNYCRAVLIMLLLFWLLWFCLAALGFLPMIAAGFQKWQQQHHWYFQAR